MPVMQWFAWVAYKTCVVDSVSSHNGVQVNPHLCLVESGELFWATATEALEQTITKPGKPGKD